MTTLATGPRVPVFDRADRMRKSLREADINVQEMASYLEVNPQTVGRWINGHVAPSKQTMRLWALRTGVPLVWLETGQAPGEPGPDEGYTARDSNPEPAGWANGLVVAFPGVHLPAAC